MRSHRAGSSAPARPQCTSLRGEQDARQAEGLREQEEAPRQRRAGRACTAESLVKCVAGHCALTSAGCGRPNIALLLVAPVAGIERADSGLARPQQGLEFHGDIELILVVVPTPDLPPLALAPHPGHVHAVRVQLPEPQGADKATINKRIPSRKKACQPPSAGLVIPRFPHSPPPRRPSASPRCMSPHRVTEVGALGVS